ncbi:MAG TPA: hypothetical protein VHX86_14740 [Tepidisphaeraceae bacterium]|jgi:hypothetical protein|nr:hypothetical protein [Tepidisphaeraceae bacterium]
MKIAHLALPTLALWAITGVLVFSGAEFGYYFLLPPGYHAGPFLDFLAQVDGQFYKEIAESGYSYDEQTFSNVAFFPAFPLSARWLSRATGLGTVCSLLVVSNGCCLAAFLLMASYTRHRTRAWATAERVSKLKGTIDEALLERQPAISSEVTTHTLLAMCLVPMTFFFRMPYSEAMFLAIAILTLYAIVLNWPLVVVAFFAGLATSVRPVAIALVLPVMWYAWVTSRSKWHAVGRFSYAVPLASWGLAAYMMFLYLRFGQPLAFAHTQLNQHMRPPAASADRVLSLLSWSPIYDAYNPASPGYWRALHNSPSRIFSMQFFNPIYWVATVLLVAWGKWKRWMSAYEVLLSIPLLAIPYLTLGYEVRMNSQARYATAVFPVYIVLGRIFARMPWVISVAIFALFGFLLGVYTALFVTDHAFL